MKSQHALRLVLASQSPRRIELLQRAGFEFDHAPTQISEIPDENLNLQDQIRDLAFRKAEACLKMGNLPQGRDYLILAADTVVVLDGQILGKPQDRLENEQYLRRLSGRRHSVITAICLFEATTGRFALGHDEAWIEFRDLEDLEITNYVNTEEGLDKAGGYGIQGAAGKFVRRLDGALDTVIGLSIELVLTLLKENGWHVDRRKP